MHQRPSDLHVSACFNRRQLRRASNLLGPSRALMMKDRALRRKLTSELSRLVGTAGSFPKTNWKGLKRPSRILLLISFPLTTSISR